MITFDDIGVRFGDVDAISHVNLHVEEGEFFTLLGPSGCGKTTALRTLAGFVTPTSGSVHIDGKDVTRLPSDKRGVGMVFQNYALFPTMSVRENIAFGPSIQRLGRQETSARVAHIAQMVNLTEQQLDRNVSELSGGQQQRVAIARALALQPRILLLDEPLSNLDAKLREQMRVQLKELQREVGITTVYVTHDQDEALSMSDRIAVFSAGHLEQVGTPAEIYHHSASPTVATFIGECSELGPASAAAIDPALAGRQCFVRLERPRLHRPDEPVTVGCVRLPATVRSGSFHGIHFRYRLDLADGTLQAIDTRGLELAPGEQVGVDLSPEDVLAYDRDGGSR